MRAPATLILVCDLDYCTQMGVTPEGGQSEITPVIKGLHSKAPSSSFSSRLLHPRCKKRHNSRSFISTTPVWLKWPVASVIPTHPPQHYGSFSSLYSISHSCLFTGKSVVCIGFIPYRTLQFSSSVRKCTNCVHTNKYSKNAAHYLRTQKRSKNWPRYERHPPQTQRKPY